MNKLTFIWLLLFLLISVDGAAQHQPDMPDSSIADFREKMIHAAQQNDTTFIFGRVDENVFNGFGYNRGKEAFRRIWKNPYQPNPIRQEVINALKIGTIYDNESNKLFAPYYFLTFPDSLDPYSYVYVLEHDVPVYTTFDTTSTITYTLSEDLVELVDGNPSASTDEKGRPLWATVRLKDGSEGSVQSRYLRSPIDYRFWFETKNGRWYLMGWAAGD